VRVFDELVGDAVAFDAPGSVESLHHGHVRAGRDHGGAPFRERVILLEQRVGVSQSGIVDGVSLDNLQRTISIFLRKP
jgi:hypothetical protein